MILSQQMSIHPRVEHLSDEELANLIGRVKAELRLATERGLFSRVEVLGKRARVLSREQTRRRKRRIVFKPPPQVPADRAPEAPRRHRRQRKRAIRFDPEPTQHELEQIEKERAWWDEIDCKRKNLAAQLAYAEERFLTQRVETLRWELERLPDRPAELETERKIRERIEDDLLDLAERYPEQCDAFAELRSHFVLADLIRDETSGCGSCDVHVEDLIAAGMSREQAEAAIENWSADEDHLDHFQAGLLHFAERPELPLEDQTDAWIGPHLSRPKGMTPQGEFRDGMIDDKILQIPDGVDS